jgi:geranylgeranyl diphosphate synthase type II
LDFIYELKTSALIESSMMIGAILAGANDEQVMAVEKIAKNVGIAFQIQDDILDVTSTAEVLGKPIMSDEKNEKTTYVTLVGLDKAKEYVESISMEAIETLHQFQTDDLFLEQLLTALIHRKK